MIVQPDTRRLVCACQVDITLSLLYHEEIAAFNREVVDVPANPLVMLPAAVTNVQSRNAGPTPVGIVTCSRNSLAALVNQPHFLDDQVGGVGRERRRGRAGCEVRNEPQVATSTLAASTLNDPAAAVVLKVGFSAPRPMTLMPATSTSMLSAAVRSSA